MSHLPLTGFALLAVSLTYALIFAPTCGIALARRRGKRRKAPDDHASDESANTLFKPLQDFYLKLLRPVIKHPLKSATLCLALIFCSFALYGKFNAGQEFFTAIESQYGIIEIRAQGNLSVEEQRDITLEVNRVVRSVEGVNQLYAYGNSNK